MRARGFADVVDRDDVRMIQRRRGFRLSDESGQAVTVVGERWRQNLQRDAAVQARVLCEIHLAHSAFAERANDLVVPQPGAVST